MSFSCAYSSGHLGCLQRSKEKIDGFGARSEFLRSRGFTVILDRESLERCGTWTVSFASSVLIRVNPGGAHSVATDSEIGLRGKSDLTGKLICGGCSACSVASDSGLGLDRETEITGTVTSAVETVTDASGGDEVDTELALDGGRRGQK